MEGLADTWSGALPTASTVGTAVDNVANAATRLIASLNCILKNGNLCNWISYGANRDDGEASVSVYDVYL